MDEPRLKGMVIGGQVRLWVLLLCRTQLSAEGENRAEVQRLRWKV